MRSAAIMMAAVLVAAGCAKSSAPHLEHVDLARLQSRLEASTTKAPGAVFGAVWRDGHRVLSAAGSADLRARRPMTAETPFAWFSVTKLFTATAILQLAEQGRVDLDAPADAYLPGMRLERDGHKASVRALLSHTAGVANPQPEIITWIHLAGERGPTIDEMIARHLGPAPKLDFVPGSRTAYSNLGYVLLGKIIERVSGQPYEDYVSGHVLAPLGCRASGFAVPADRATGYQRKWTFTNLMMQFLIDRRFVGGSIDGYQELEPLTVDGIPHGGLNGPADCLLRFARMTMEDGRGENGRVLAAQSVRAMLTPTRLNDGRTATFGLAWRLGTIDGEPFADHTGGGGGYVSDLRVYPRLGYAVVVLGNETNYPAHELATLVIPNPDERVQADSSTR